MPYTEVHRGIIRVRYKTPSGKYIPASVNDKGERFADAEEAMEYGRYQESLIKRGLWTDPNAPKILFEEWAEQWYAGLDLEPTTMARYRSLLQGHLMRKFKGRELVSIVYEEMAPWEREMVVARYAPRTARDCRSLLITMLQDAVPLHIPLNPALRRRGKGRKGLKRVERARRAAKVWAAPLQVILIAERAAMLAGNVDVFLMFITVAWTGLRWSEVLALTPQALLKNGQIDIAWKLYELSGFYWGIPKDGSLRKLHQPPFLRALLAEQAKRARACRCTGRDAELPRIDGEEAVEWCTGARRLLFLTPEGAHYGRGDFSGRVMRPAADGFYPGRTGKRARAPKPVTVQVGGGTMWEADQVPFPGMPLRPSWPYASVPPGMDWRSYPELGEWEMPRRRGQWRWLPKDEEACRHIASWLPLLPGLTPHGLRHGHQTWLDDGNIKKALKVDRMGHEDLTMSGLYGHITDAMVTELEELLQGLWEMAVAARFEIHPRSPIPILDVAMAPWREGKADGAVTLMRRAR